MLPISSTPNDEQIRASRQHHLGVSISPAVLAEKLHVPSRQTAGCFGTGAVGSRGGSVDPTSAIAVGVVIAIDQRCHLFPRLLRRGWPLWRS